MKGFAWLALGALAISGAAWGAPPAPPPPKLFLSPSGEPFRATPADADPLKTWFDQADTKHQGYLDRDEFRADAARFFKRLDTNGDGVVDGFEVTDYEHKLVPELAAEAEGPPPPPVKGNRGEGRGGGPRGGRERGGAGEARQAGDRGADADAGRDRGRAQRRIEQLIGEPEPVTGADFNFDTHITLAEWLRATDQRFEILDEKKDGKLTLEELRARFLPGPKTP